MLPKHVTILGETFNILRPKDLQLDGEDVHGTYDYDTRAICVKADLDDREAASTLIHEMTHAWLDASAISSLLSLTDEQEEGLVLALERQFMPVVAEVLGSDLLAPKSPKKRAAKTKRKGRK